MTLRSLWGLLAGVLILMILVAPPLLRACFPERIAPAAPRLDTPTSPSPTISSASVPVSEPGALILASLGLLALGAASRMRRAGPMPSRLRIRWPGSNGGGAQSIGTGGE